MYIYLVTAFSIAGLVRLYRRDVTSAVVRVSCLVAFPLVYYVVEFEDRYRYPIMWLTFLLGSLPIATSLGLTGQERPNTPNKVAPSLPVTTTSPS